MRPYLRSVSWWARSTVAVGGALAPCLAAAQVSVTVSAPASLAPGEPALVRVEVTAPARATLRLVPPDVSPFTVTSATRLADAGARAGWQRQEWRYVLAQPGTGARGRYAFEPFTAEAQGARLRGTYAVSRAWALEVRAGAAPGAGPNIAAGRPGVAPAAAPAVVPNAPPGAAAPAPAAGVTFTARVTPAVVYVGQQATYELTVGVSAEARARIRRSPEFVPAELRGVLAYDLPATHRGDASGDLHVYRRALFALTPGAVSVPSARLTYGLATRLGFFAPEERRVVLSEALRLTAVAPPLAGRPAGWDGAVGALAATARTNVRTLRAGDALEYSVDVAGTGNLALLPRPRLAVSWADVVDAGDRATVDSVDATVRGRRTFTWLLTPRAPGGFRTPAVDYPYFDPDARAYAITTAPPMDVEVTPGAAPTIAQAALSARERLGVRAAWRGPRDPALPTRAGFWLALGIAPAPGALAWLAAGARRAGRRRGPARSADRARGADAPGTERVSGEAAALRLHLDRTLAARVGFGAGDFAASGGLAAALRRVGVAAPTAARVARLAAALDAAAYDAPVAADGAEPSADRALAREVATALRDVDREARPRAVLVGARARVAGATRAATRGAARLLFAAAVCWGVGAVGCARRVADPATPAARAFAEGVTAYQAGQVRAARSAFAAAAAAAPRAPDAWANAGTAAWADADTVAAAVAWQRALRLEPTAADVRARLALLPAAQDGAVAEVWPVPPDPVAAIALALAGAAALLALLAARPSTRRRMPTATWVGTWGAALAVGGAAQGLEWRLRPAGLAIVRTAAALREEPALDAESGAPAERTDVARVLERSGAWTRVRLDGGRDGWLAADALEPLVVSEDPTPATAAVSGSASPPR